MIFWGERKPGPIWQINRHLISAAFEDDHVSLPQISKKKKKQGQNKQVTTRNTWETWLLVPVCFETTSYSAKQWNLQPQNRINHFIALKLMRTDFEIWQCDSVLIEEKGGLGWSKLSYVKRVGGGNREVYGCFCLLFAKGIVCHLCKGQASLIVHLEDLLDGIDVSCRPQIQAQVVLVCRAHNLLQRKILLHEYRFASINFNNICAMGEVAFFARWSYHTILKWAWSEGWTFWKIFEQFHGNTKLLWSSWGGVKGGSCSTCCRFTGSTIEWFYGRQLQHVTLQWHKNSLPWPTSPWCRQDQSAQCPSQRLPVSNTNTSHQCTNLTWGLRIAGPKQN